MDCTPRDRRTRDHLAANRAAFPPAAATRVRRCAARHATPVHRRRTTPTRRADCTTDAPRLDRLRRHRRLPGRDERLSLIGRVRSCFGDLPLSHLHVFPYPRSSGHRASVMPDKVDATVRDPRVAVRRIGGDGIRFGARRWARAARSVDDERWPARHRQWLTMDGRSGDAKPTT